MMPGLNNILHAPVDPYRMDPWWWLLHWQTQDKYFGINFHSCVYIQEW